MIHLISQMNCFIESNPLCTKSVSVMQKLHLNHQTAGSKHSATPADSADSLGLQGIFRILRISGQDLSALGCLCPLDPGSKKKLKWSAFGILDGTSA